MSMRTKDINNLADLRKVKTEMKARMKEADENLQDGWLFSTLNGLFGKNKGSRAISPALDSGTLGAMKFLGSQQQGRFGEIISRALPIATTIAAPLLVRFATKWIQRRFRA